MPKLLNGKKTAASLPKNKPLPLLPEPKITIWPDFILISLPVIFVLVYAFIPQFGISNGSVRLIIEVAIFTFLFALVALIFTFVRYLYDLIKPRPAQAATDKGILILLFVFLLSLAFLTVIVWMIELY
ncbi:MAG: hypothetical protein WCV50_06590 [Patescibacteria group bacterium]|jgi:hypothetical protein